MKEEGEVALRKWLFCQLALLAELAFDRLDSYSGYHTVRYPFPPYPNHCLSISKSQYAQLLSHWTVASLTFDDQA